MIFNKTFQNKTLPIYVPQSLISEKTLFPVAYILGVDSTEKLQTIVDNLVNKNLVLVGIPSDSWEKDFTPWPSVGLKNRPQFLGQAFDFLKNFVENIKPEIEKEFPVFQNKNKIILAGYSLAGLTSLYAAFVTDFASNFAGVSASLWYSGWTDFCEANNFMPKDFESTDCSYNFYLSVGDKECVTKNSLMAGVNQCFEKTEKILKLKKNTKVFFEFNSGGHFCESEKRLAKGIDYLCNKMN